MLTVAHAPVFEFFGAYFPSWLPAMLCGVIGASLLRAALGRAGLHDRIPLPLLTYVAATVLVACAARLLLA